MLPGPQLGREREGLALLPRRGGAVRPLTTVCPGCGLPGAAGGSTHAYLGASSSCWTRYGELLAREYGDPAYMAAHRLTVDAYCAQHPGVPERRTIQSAHVHLLGLHLMLEREWPEARVRAAMASATRQSGLTWLEPPAQPADLTVADVLAASDAVEHGRRACDWAAAVWASWTAHHPIIRALAATISQPPLPLPRHLSETTPPPTRPA